MLMGVLSTTAITLSVRNSENYIFSCHGFAIVKVDDRVTSNPDDICIGNDIGIILSGIEIKSTVKQKDKYDGKDFNL